MNPVTAENDALIIIDPQIDFCPGGALAVSGGDEIFPMVNQLARNFSHIVLTQDWHPPGHRSFASAHPGRSAFETIEVDYGSQTLWPDHCVQGTDGAAFHPALAVPHVELIIRKGYRLTIDSYSAFRENDRKTPTGLTLFARAGLRTTYSLWPRNRFLCVVLSTRCADGRIQNRRGGCRNSCNRHRWIACARSRDNAGRRSRPDPTLL